jgi:hypothetical protein
VKSQVSLGVKRLESGKDKATIFKEKPSSDKSSKVQNHEQKCSGLRPERV